MWTTSSRKKDSRSRINKNLRINNTNLSAENVAKMIKDEFKL